MRKCWFDSDTSFLLTFIIYLFPPLDQVSFHRSVSQSLSSHLPPATFIVFSAVSGASAFDYMYIFHITVARGCYFESICYPGPVIPVSLLWPLSSARAFQDHCWLAFLTLWITAITDCTAPKSQEAVTFWNNMSGTDNHTTSKVTLTTRLCHSNI